MFAEVFGLRDFGVNRPPSRPALSRRCVTRTGSNPYISPLSRCTGAVTGGGGHRLIKHSGSVCPQIGSRLPPIVGATI